MLHVPCLDRVMDAFSTAMAASIIDYIFRRLALDYLPFEKRAALGIYSAEERKRQLETRSYEVAMDPDVDLALSLGGSF
jgi:hypothetical protein